LTEVGSKRVEALSKPGEEEEEKGREDCCRESHEKPEKHAGARAFVDREVGDSQDQKAQAKGKKQNNGSTPEDRKQSGREIFKDSGSESHKEDKQKEEESESGPARRAILSFGEATKDRERTYLTSLYNGEQTKDQSRCEADAQAREDRKGGEYDW
jgi:hypothetical protein